MGLRPENKGWGRIFHLWNRWELWATGLGSDVGETKCKNGNTASSEGLACRTLLTPRGESILPIRVCQVFLDLQMLRRNWRVGLGPPYLETRTAPREQEYREASSWSLPRMWQADWQHACCYSPGSWAETTVTFPFNTAGYDLRHPSVRLEPQWVDKGK